MEISSLIPMMNEFKPVLKSVYRRGKFDLRLKKLIPEGTSYGALSCVRECMAFSF